MGNHPPSDDDKSRREIQRDDETQARLERAARRKLRVAILEKFDFIPDYESRSSRTDRGDRPGFEVLLNHILGLSTALPVTSLVLSNRGRVLGKLQQTFADIAEPVKLEPYVGLCELEYGIAMICNFAERNGLTTTERAYLLSELPRLPLDD